MHQDLPWFAQKITHLEYVCIMFALFIPHCSYCSLTTDDYALPHFMPRVSYFTLTVRSRIIPSNQLVSMEFRQNAWLFLYGKVAVAGPLHVWGFLLNLCNFLVQETILWIESIFKPPFICQTPKVPLFTPQKKKTTKWPHLGHLFGPSRHLSSQELHQIFDGRPDLTHHLQVAKGQHLGSTQCSRKLFWLGRVYTPCTTNNHIRCLHQSPRFAQYWTSYGLWFSHVSSCPPIDVVYDIDRSPSCFCMFLPIE